MTTCPSTDWRQPWVVDAYNAMLKTACSEEGIHVIDTNELVIGPIWDSAWDWCHFHHRGFPALAGLVLDTLSVGV